MDVSTGFDESGNAEVQEFTRYDTARGDAFVRENSETVHIVCRKNKKLIFLTRLKKMVFDVNSYHVMLKDSSFHTFVPFGTGFSRLFIFM